jgi:SAM-dependent methyltransferase
VRWLPVGRHTIVHIRPRSIPRALVRAIDLNPERGVVRMRVHYARVPEDAGWKVPLVWDYDDLRKLKGLDRLVEAVKGKTVVEIGGGNGYLAYVLAHFASRVDTFEGWAPYAVVYSNYIFPYVVEKGLNLNYVIKYVTEDDLKYLPKYDVGVYSGVADHTTILKMLREVSKEVKWVTFCDFGKEKVDPALIDDLSICVFDVTNV